MLLLKILKLPNGYDIPRLHADEMFILMITKARLSK